MKPNTRLCSTTLGKMDKARSDFEKAFEGLKKDEWFVKKEAARLAKLKPRAGIQ